MKRLLIANRGEIACRVIRACDSLGIETVAVFSDVDADALHVQMADVAVPIGPAPAAESYLNVERVLAAAKAQDCDAVHPGYGFLSENADFARAVEASGMIWIGPTPRSIEEMGNKSRSREIARAAGLPILPGSGHFGWRALDGLEEAASKVGFPLLVKAASGGGGIGMRRVERPDALEAAVNATQEQSAKSFGNGSIYLERYVPRARHIEIQVFGYGDGEALHLFERECSVQRRFQKIIEESPAPGLPPDVLRRMADVATSLAANQRYRGPGTVEFIFDADTRNFYFLEMNTRIQVEHPVTEMVTGWDLVEQQILLAAGRAKKFAQEQVERRGAAIECRLYAENPAKGFLPSPGRLAVFTLPERTDDVRVDTGVRQGDTVTPYYDPMIAKMITWGPDRDAALGRMREALARTKIEGVKNNAGFLRAILDHPDFRSGDIDTGFTERERLALLNAMPAEI